MTVAWSILIRNIFTGLVCALLLTESVQAQSAPPGLSSDQPIDINADRLEIQQDKNLAIFSGNVVAEQGTIKLRAAQLKVWYRSPSVKSSANHLTSGSTIIRIVAIDQVFVSSATETARGDLGIYEVGKQLLTLTGTVILTRGENVLRGNKLVMNIATGQSQFSGGRVHGRFVPPKREKGAKK